MKHLRSSPSSDQLYRNLEKLERAADMLTAYAELIRRGSLNQIEQYQYLPEVEDLAKTLRMLASEPDSSAATTVISTTQGVIR